MVVLLPVHKECNQRSGAISHNTYPYGPNLDLPFQSMRKMCESARETRATNRLTLVTGRTAHRPSYVRVISCVLAVAVLVVAGCHRTGLTREDGSLLARGAPTTYASEIPCDTCPLFRYVLNLYPDSTFRWRTNAGNPAAPYPPLSHVDRGKWRVAKDQNLLMLEGEQEGTRALAILTSRRLETRAPDGSPTTWALSYLLTRQDTLDSFRVPFTIEGGFTFNDDGSGTFTNCLTREQSLVKKGPHLDSLRLTQMSRDIPAGRSMKVWGHGYFVPVPRPTIGLDTLFTADIKSDSWQNGCREIYPRLTFGGVEWRLYRIGSQSIEPSNPTVPTMVADTVERTITFHVNGCRGTAMIENLRNPWPSMRISVVDRSGQCEAPARQMADSVARALERTRRTQIHDDILMLIGEGGIPGRALGVKRVSH